MAKAKRIGSSGSGLGSNIAQQVGPAPVRRTGGGTGRPRPRRSANDDPIAMANKIIAAKKLAAEGSGDGGLMDIVGDVLGGGKKVLTGALDAIDTPRAALLSFGSELGDLVDPDGDGSFDLGTAVKRTRDNYSFGEFLNDEVAQSQDWNKWAKVAASIVGDIAIDPLTYLAPGAKIGKAGAEGTAKALFRAGADDLARGGIDAEQAASAAARVAKSRSVGSLSDAERAAAGLADDAGHVERGVYWNAPGTGRIGRRLHIDEAIDKVTGGRYGLSRGDRTLSKQIRLGGGKGLSRAHEVAMKPVAAVANRLTSKVKVANGADAAFKEMFRSGDPEVARMGWGGIESSAMGRAQDKRFELEFGQRVTGLLHDARKAKVDMHDLWLAAGGDGPAVERITKQSGADLVEQTRALFDDMGIEANTRIVNHGGQEILNIRDHYTPRFLKPEVREQMGLKPQVFPRKGKAASIEKARKYVEGEELFGKRLMAPAEHPEHWSIERQVDDILADNGIDQSWFIEDASVAFPLYVKVLSRRVGNEVTAGELIQKGLGEFAYGYTNNGQRVIAAREHAFSMGEAARRRARMAQEEVGDAADRLISGRKVADQSAKAAKAATQDARTAAQEAAQAVDEAALVPHKGAEAVREFAEHTQDMADRRSASLQRFIQSANDEIERTTLQAAGLRAEAKIIEGNFAATHDRLRRLLDAKDAAWAKVQRAWEAVDNRVGSARTLRSLETEVEGLQQEIRDANDLIDELGTAVIRRHPDEINSELGAVVSTQRGLGSKIAAAEKRGDMDAVARLKRDQETARLWNQALRHELKTGKILDDEEVEFLGLARDSLSQSRGRLQQARQQAQAIGRDDVAQEFARLEDSLPRWDETTQRLVSRDGLPWHHGSPTGGDLTIPRTNLPMTDQTEIDSALGLHLTDQQSAAKRYAKRAAQGTEGDPAAMGVGTFEIAATPDDVVNYAEVDWDYIENFAPNADFWDKVNRFGSPFGPSKAQIMDEAMTAAYHDGVLGTDDIYHAIERNLGHLPDEVADELDLAMQHVESLVDEEGMSLRDALSSALTDTVFDPLHGMDDVGWVHPTRVGTHWLLQTELNSSSDLVAQIADSFKELPHVKGKKALFYDHGYGGTEAILLDPQVAREVSVARPDPSIPNGAFFTDPANPRAKPLMRTWEDKHKELRTLMHREAYRAMDEATKWDGPIVDAEMSFEGVARAAEQNRTALDRAERTLGRQRGALKQGVMDGLNEEVALRRRAAELFDEADQIQQAFVQGEMVKAAQLGDLYSARQVDEVRIATHNQRQIVQLEAQYQSALADLAKFDASATRWDGRLDALNNTHAERAIDTALSRGLRQFGASTLLPEDMVEVLTATTRLREPGWAKKFLGHYDGVLNLWKGYATMSPGFLNRNLMGGVFNNYLADIDPSAYKFYRRLSSEGGRGLHPLKGKAGAAWREAYESAHEVGVLTGGQSVGEVAMRLGQGASVSPLKAEFAPIRAVRSGSARVENFLRGSLYMDVYVKTGGNVDEALAAVNKFHFDYDDLAAAERSVMRRVVPFYTWTRKNLPLQLEMLARKPAKYNKFNIAKNNVEALSSEEDEVPGYFGENFGVRLPWQREGGNVYFLPDLPFTNVGEVLEPNQAIANTSPFLKTPIELWAGKQFWQDIPFTDKHKPVSPLMTAVPGLMPALAGVGWATKNASGDWVMKDRHLSAVTNWLPVLGQARRLVPAEAKYQQRALTSWLSFFGAGLRTNTADEKQSIRWGSYYDLKDELAKLEDLGFLQSSYDGPAQTPAQQANAPFSAMASEMEDFEVSPEAMAEDEDLLGFGG